jgi:DHA2 family multidrug resistance protein-like MFS transporter
MDLTVLNLAVPHLSADLRPSSAQLLWIIDIYGFLVAGSLITMGTLGDRIGRRRLLMIGAGAFGVASVIAAFAPTANALIASRALLGVTGATIAPSTLSLIRNMFPHPEERTFAIGVWATSYSVGGAIGPLLGGILLEHFWWGSVFLLSVPVMVLLLVVGPKLLPEYRDINAGRLDLASAALSLLAVLAMIYGLKHWAEHGLGVVGLGIFAAGLALGAIFVRRQRRLASPLIDLRLFASPAFTVSLVLYTSVAFTAFGVYIFLGQYLQLVLGLSPLKAGLWTVPMMLAFVVGSLTSPALLRRVRPALAMAGGFIAGAIGFAMLTTVSDQTSLGVIVAASVIYNFGMCPIVILATDLIVGSAPPEHAGAAASISETGAELGGALGIAILGSIGTAVYRSVMAGDLMATLTPKVAEAVRGTLGGALGVADQVPAEQRAALIGQARDAFIDSFQVAAAISTVVALIAAVVGFVVLRHRPLPATH